MGAFVLDAANAQAQKETKEERDKKVKTEQAHTDEQVAKYDANRKEYCDKIDSNMKYA